MCLEKLRDILSPAVYEELLRRREREQFLVGHYGQIPDWELPEWGDEIPDDYRPEHQRGIIGPRGGE
ncbi:MAG TPA: hypothetical protein PK263_01945 [bacterium]|nr:hypothetical protein [bacterium]